MAMTDILATSLVATGVDKYVNQMRRAQYSVQSFRNTIDDVNKTQPIGGGGTGGMMGAFGLAGPEKWITIAGAVGAVGLAAGSSAMQFESMAATLETIAGSKAGARGLMDWVTEFASKTPFELQETTSALIRLRSYGIDPLNGSLEKIGNMSSVMNRSISQGVEAVADAMMGEWERMKEFGLKRKMLEDYMAKKGMAPAFNKQGQITDPEAMQKGLFGWMDERFAGGMLNKMDTLGGKLSNFKDGVTVTLATLGAGLSPLFKGVMDLGISAFTMLKDVITPIAPILMIVASAIGLALKQSGMILVALGKIVAVPLTLVAVGILGWVKAAQWAWDKLKGFGRWLEGTFIGVIIDKLGKAWDWVAKRYEALVGLLKEGGMLPKMEKDIPALFPTLARMATTAITGMEIGVNEVASRIGDISSMADKLNLSQKQKNLLTALEVKEQLNLIKISRGMLGILSMSSNPEDKNAMVEHYQKIWNAKKKILELAYREKDVDRSRREVLGGGSLAQAGVKQWEVWRRIRGGLARSVESPRFKVQVDVKGEGGLDGFVRQIAEQILSQGLEWVAKTGQREFGRSFGIE